MSVMALRSLLAKLCRLYRAAVDKLRQCCPAQAGNRASAFWPRQPNEFGLSDDRAVSNLGHDKGVRSVVASALGFDF